MLNSVIKYILLSIGSLSLVLGIIGILLPVMPTTPFLLLTAFCYLRSSRRLYNWLINHKIFGGYIYNYMTYKAVTKLTKVMAFFFLWWGIIASMLLVNRLHVRLILTLVGIGVSAHLYRLKTIRKSEMHKPKLIETDSTDL